MMLRSGCLRVREADYAIAVGKLGAAGVTVAGPEGKAIVDELKRVVARLRRQAAADTDHLVEDFPENPADLPEPWLTRCQADGPLVPCPFGTATVEWFSKQTPGRKSHWSMKANEAEAPSSQQLAPWQRPDMPALPPQMQMQQMQMQMQMLAPWQQMQMQQLQQMQRMLSTQPQQPPLLQFYGHSRLQPPNLWGEAPGLQPGTPQFRPPMALENSTVSMEELSEVAPDDVPQASDGCEAAAAAVPGAELAASPRTSAPSAAAAASAAAGRFPLADVLQDATNLVTHKQEQAGGTRKRPKQGESESESDDSCGETEPKKGKRRMRRKGPAHPMPSSAPGLAAATTRPPTAAATETAAATIKPPKAEAKETAAAKEKKAAAPTMAPKDDSVLAFKSPKTRPPIKYGWITIYTDMKNKLWRLKPEPSSKQLIHHSWKKQTPKAAWEDLIKDVKRLS